MLCAQKESSTSCKKKKKKDVNVVRQTIPASKAGRMVGFENTASHVS